MRHLAVALATTFLLAGCTHAAPAAQPEQYIADDEAALDRLDARWIAAEIDGDREALESLLHEGFLSTFQSGKTIGRKAYIDFILNAAIEPFTVTHESITVHGDTAVVVDLLDGGNTKFTWVAIRRGGDWRVIAQTFSSYKQENKAE